MLVKMPHSEKFAPFSKIIFFFVQSWTQCWKTLLRKEGKLISKSNRTLTLRYKLFRMEFLKTEPVQSFLFISQHSFYQVTKKKCESHYFQFMLSSSSLHKSHNKVGLSWAKFRPIEVVPEKIMTKFTGFLDKVCFDICLPPHYWEPILSWSKMVTSRKMFSFSSNQQLLMPCFKFTNVCLFQHGEKFWERIGPWFRKNSIVLMFTSIIIK